MTQPLENITIYSPIKDARPYGVFPVTDSCERSATVMGDDYVKLSFKAVERYVFGAFAYIYYDNQLFFLKETYRPTNKGSYYEYEVKFVSVANMLDKHICFRYVDVVGEDVAPEPEINMNGTLQDMATIILDAIKGAVQRMDSNLYYAYILQRLVVAEDILQGTDLKTFSFSGQNIADVLTQVVNEYDTEWWVSQPEKDTVLLHLCKCECNDTILVSDQYKDTGNALQPYASRGLLSCEYAQDWTNIAQKIIPFGSDRNLTRKQALQDVNGNSMYVSYGKHLRLAPNTTYSVKGRDGNTTQITTDNIGALTNTGVQSGIETTKTYEDIYPRCHFKVLSVNVKGTDNPIYTITAGAIKADGQTVMTYTEMKTAGLLPLRIEPNETLSVIFESGYLNGREFEVALKTKNSEWTLSIVPDGDKDNGVQVPFGNFIPRVGDTFAIFHMIMPEYYITRAQEELAQATYDDLLAIEDTRPEIKCKTEPLFFANQHLCLGQRVGVYSELFGNVTFTPAGEPTEDSTLFVSRVTSFSHSLTTPNSADFKLASARIEGRLTAIENSIADQTDDIRGLEQRAINLSRRGWHDATEMKDMLNSLASEMMLVGVEKNQFAFTPSIECVNDEVAKVFHHLHVSAGTLQHTQEPYIKYANSGKWEINLTDLTTDEQGNILDPSTPYYLYAKCAEGVTTAEIVLSENSKDSDTDYLLMGILSSVFEDEQDGTAYRVFNRSNGYTQIAGGTITTEQIQDQTRSLIIDFQHNPPRIIAKDRAEIIGNISFYAPDGGIYNISDYLDDEYGYLKRALNKGTTEISGGLLMTNVLALKNEQGTISAGMSGLQGDINHPENVLMWGGGTYQQALYASKNAEYKKSSNGTPITTLIKKDGTCKIGIFRINDTQAIVKTNNGTVIIDTNTGICCYRNEGTDPIIVISTKELPPLETLKGDIERHSGGQGGLLEGTYTKSAQYTIDEISTPVKVLATIYVGDNATVMVSSRVNFQVIPNSSLRNVGTEWKDYAYITDSNGQRVDGKVTNSQATFNIREAGTYTINVWSTISGLEWSPNYDEDQRYEVRALCEESYFSYEYSYRVAKKQTMIAYGGIFSYIGEQKYLYYKDGVGLDCRMGENRLQITNDGIFMDGLPTSSDRLSKGQLYTDNNHNVKVIP